MKLYKIWRVTHNVNKPVPKSCSYVVEEDGNWAYPLVEVICTMSSRWYRDDFVSTDLAKLQEKAGFWPLIVYEGWIYTVKFWPNNDYYKMALAYNQPFGTTWIHEMWLKND